MSLIHIRHEDVFDTIIHENEIVLIECDTIPYNLVELSDHVLSKNALPMYAIRHDAYSFIKIRKSELSDMNAGLCIVSEYNNNFTNTFVFESEKLDLEKPVYITQTKKIRDFTKHLALSGVEYTACDHNKLADMIHRLNPDRFEFKTDVVKCKGHEKALESILSTCMRFIRNNGYGEEYVKRLEKELHQYNRFGLVDMIYDVYLYYKSWDNKLVLRGSANNSLVIYCLGISKIDPVRFDLPFERFINAGKIFEEV